MSLEELTKQFNILRQDFDNLDKPEMSLGMTLIAEEVLSGSVASVTFSSISQSFRNLALFCELRTDAAVELDVGRIRFNGDSAANYDIQTINGSSTTTSATVVRATASSSLYLSEGANSRASCFSPNFSIIFDYANSALEKFAIGLSSVYGDRSANTDLFASLRTIAWRNTAAITSIAIVPSAGPNFVSGSKFQLYGIK